MSNEINGNAAIGVTLLGGGIGAAATKVFYSDLVDRIKLAQIRDTTADNLLLEAFAQGNRANTGPYMTPFEQTAVKVSQHAEEKLTLLKSLFAANRRTCALGGALVALVGYLFYTQNKK